MEEGVVTARGLAGGEKVETLPQDPIALHDNLRGRQPGHDAARGMARRLAATFEATKAKTIREPDDRVTSSLRLSAETRV